MGVGGNAKNQQPDGIGWHKDYKSMEPVGAPAGLPMINPRGSRAPGKAEAHPTTHQASGKSMQPASFRRI